MTPMTSAPIVPRRRWWTLPLSALLTLGAILTVPASQAFADDDEYEEVEVEELADDEIADDDPSAVIIFRDRLSPYGAWIDHPDYGTLWVPSSKLVGPDFAPYVSEGRWELTDDGDWLWVSDYDWGYVPFHYGRWVWVSGLGWSWIPGRVYAPAWVVWRTGADGYIGWAPAPPSYYWVDGWAYSWWGVPVAAYVFCPTVHVFHHHVHTVVIHDHDDVHRAAKATRPHVAARPRTKHTAATPTANGGNTPRMGPSADEAGLKKSDLPKKTGKPSAKSLEFMKPESIAKSKELAKTKKAPAPQAAALGSKAPATSTKAAGVNGFVAPSRSVEKPAKRATKVLPTPSSGSKLTPSSKLSPSSPSRDVSPKASPKPQPKAQPYAPDPSFDFDDRPAPKSPKAHKPSQSSPPSAIPSPKAPKSRPHPKASPSPGPSHSSPAPQPSPKAPSVSKKSPAPAAQPQAPAGSAPKKAAPKSGGGARSKPSGKKSR